MRSCLVRLATPILLFATGLLSAQSFFNTQGLGEIGRVADARSASLGTHAALSWHNPAWLLRLPRTNITASLLGAGTVGIEQTGSRFVGTVRPAGFYAGIPLPLDGRLTLGLDEKFNQDFDIWTAPLPGNDYRYRVISRGGVYALKTGLAWAFLDAGCVGVEYARLLGASREHWRLEAIDGNSVSVDTIETDYAAHSLKFGASSEIGRLGFGAWYAPAVDYQVETLRRVHGVIGESLRLQQIRLPGTATAGLSYATTDRLEISAGIEYRPWSGVTIDNKPAKSWQNAWRASGGLQLALDTMRAIRFGYSRSTGYRALDWGTAAARPVTENRLHLGTGLPVGGFGSLDFALEVGQRANGSLTEYVGRILVSLAYRESWHRRTRRWGY